MAAVLDYAERRTRSAIEELPDGTYRASDSMQADAGSPVELCVSVEVRGERDQVDFDGSADQVPGNLNCPLAVTRAAVRYAVRVLTDPDAPPSAGAYRPIEIEAAEGSRAQRPPRRRGRRRQRRDLSRVADLVLAALADAAAGRLRDRAR